MVLHTFCRASLMSMRFRKLSTASRCVYPRRLSLFLLSITVVCVLFFEFSALESMKRGRMSRSVSFDKVPVDETGVLRFAAVDTATGEKISFEDWIRIIADTESSDDTIQKLTTILKVSWFACWFVCDTSPVSFRHGGSHCRRNRYFAEPSSVGAQSCDYW